MEKLLLKAFLRTEKRSFGLPQVVRLTTVTAGTTEQLIAGGIRMNRVGIDVRFVGADNRFIQYTKSLNHNRKNPLFQC
jgi:hypothetical protein